MSRVLVDVGGCLGTGAVARSGMIMVCMWGTLPTSSG